MRITLTPKMDHFTFLDGPIHFLVVEKSGELDEWVRTAHNGRVGKEGWAMFRLQNGGRTLVKHNNQL